MPNEIMSAHEVHEDDPEVEVSDLTATEKPTGDRMEFHVQMRGYTLADMEDLIVAAAARQILGRSSDTAIAKRIEEAATSAISARINDKLREVSAEVIDQPLTPSFGDKKPVTVREFVGLCGREFLTQNVDSRGNPTTGGWGSDAVPRLQRIVSQIIDAKFKREIEAATNAAVREVRDELKAEHARIIEAEKARFREALGKFSE